LFYLSGGFKGGSAPITEEMSFFLSKYLSF